MEYIEPYSRTSRIARLDSTYGWIFAAALGTTIVTVRSNGLAQHAPHFLHSRLTASLPSRHPV
ncbi:hypothetical protein BAUCODRAFT_334639 [Baudoinia panamericana UAMH 10762]|uniref:Uncharacterized protein n=1 Tax=Baudoinia panamericana (strain UAMH 10762) TaxID=717646 RepID=M2MW93_BAUPA|nr:uncharacterized protein BAUCODRAFT_334639 [Baudoinia panamericana UAMH 10762]EMC90849.1 hypothetical protein BAUCODRAFT_334639 [Baudoinia panamericana UAMH 10762]